MSSEKAVKPFAICMTGISGSGKTTLAKALHKRLKEYGAVDIIDGDETRGIISGLFGYSKEERIKMNKVNQAIGWYLLRNKISFIMAVVAPYEEIRARFREAFGDAYIEIYVKASVEACAERDVKGLYALSKAGKIENLNGSNDVFETPERSDILINTETTSVDESCGIVWNYLIKNGFIK